MEKTHTHTVSRAAGYLVAAAAMMPVASLAQDYSDLAKIEVQRRKAAAMNVDTLIQEAREAYTKKDYQLAVDTYRKALNTLPQGRILDDRREFLSESLAQASIALSKDLNRKGDRDAALTTLEEVLKADPDNQEADVALDKLYDARRNNPSATADHAANVDRVRRHLYKGEGYYNLGQYDLANKEFDKVIRIDPYNQAARRWQVTVNKERRDYYRSAYDATRSELLTAVDRAWEIVPPPVVSIRPDGRTGGGEQQITGVLLQERKLKELIVPRVDFENATLESVISRLTSISRSIDTTTSEQDKKGLSFVIRKRNTVVGSDVDGSGNDIRIDKLELTNVPLGEVLRQVCLKCNPRMRVKVEEFVVAIVPATTVDGDSELFHRMFNVPPDFQERLRGTSSSDSGGGGDDIFADEETAAPQVESLKDTFTKMGVKFPEGADVQFIAATSTLSVTNTSVGLDQIDRIVRDIGELIPKQINITTKFIEISQQDNDELGFDWIISPFGLTGNSLFLGGGTVGNGTARNATNFSGSVSNTAISGIPASGNVFNTPTSGLRSGDTAITRDSINFFLNNPTRTAQTSNVAPGILSLTGLFSDGQVQMIMRGLAQKKGTDVMNAPTVMARPGERARIEVVRQFIYPTEYDPPEVPDNIGGGLGGNNNNGGGNDFTVIPITPATPTAFEERPTGVILEIEPNLGAGTENRTISLDIEPEIVEFEGFINYGSPIQAVAVDALGNPVQITVTENRIEMPVFSKRTVKTGLTIYDGHTVAVGGLMSEEVQKVEDKVPVLGDIPLLGRLFQSNAENRIKTNLVIFVTANIIDATGRKLYSNDPGAVNPNTGGTAPASYISADLLPQL